MGVVDARFRSAAFAVDLGAAAKAVDAVDIHYLPQSWGSLIEEAIRLLEQNDKPRKELYILSDLTAPTWEETLDGRLVERLKAASDVAVQVIDVGVDEPQNDALVQLQLSAQLAANGSPLSIQTRIGRYGSAGSRTLRLLIEPQDEVGPIVVDGQLQLPPATVRGKETVELDRDGSAEVTFSVAALGLGTHHGYVEIEGEDSLAVDNRRHFTVHVGPPWPILVAAPPDAVTQFLTEALAPYEFRETGRARFAPTAIELPQLANQDLRGYAAVALLDPTPLTDEVWQKLRRYVERGGGLAIFLGRQAAPPGQFNSPAALELLPAAIRRQWRDDEGLYFAPRDYDHPITSAFRDLRTTVPWNTMPIYRHWVLGPRAEGGRVILNFGNNKPALVERRLGEGIVLLVTTPISETESRGRPAWNQIATSLDPWPFLVLVDRMFLSLVGSSRVSLNCLVGQTARLPWQATGTERLPLMTPRGDWREVTASKGEIRVPLTDQPGAYRLKVPAETPTPHGFSANLSPDTSRLDRITSEQIAQCLGSDRFRLAKNEQEIVREIDQARIGREFYPLLLIVLVVIMLLEYVLANRFYSQDP